MSFYNFVKIVGWLPLSILYPTKVYGKENYNRDKAVLCCNHYGSTDVVIVSQKLLWGSCHCVGKEELFRHKASAWFLRKLGAIAVRRGESDLQAFRSIMQVLNSGEQLLIFPEGTRNKAGTPELQPLQPGAAVFALKAQCPIIPMVLHAKAKPFRRSYMMIGTPMDMSVYADMPAKEARVKATEDLAATMGRLKMQLDATVEQKAKRKRADRG